MDKYVGFIYKYQKVIIVVFVLTMLFMLLGIFRIDINTDFDIFKVTESEYLDVIEKMNDIYGESKMTFLVYEDGNRDQIEAWLDQVGIQYMKPDLIESFYEGEIEKDGKTYLTYLLEVNTSQELTDLKKTLSGTYYMSGDLYMQSEILNLIQSVLIFIPPFALLLVLMVFRSQLSSFKATILSVMPAGISAVWTMGIVGWMGQEVSIITVLAPIFSIVIGSADGLHFITHMEEAFNLNKSPKEALEESLSVVGMPMVITTTTSVAGFLALMMINTTAIRSLAIFASLGVILAGLITWILLPIIFSTGLELTYKKQRIHVNFLKKLWRKSSIYIVAFILLLAISFIPRISTEFNQFMFFKSYTDVQKNADKIMALHDGAIPMFYYGRVDISQIEEKLPSIMESLETLDQSDAVKRVINPLEESFEFDLKKLNQVKNFIRLENTNLHYRFMFFPKDLKNETMDQILLDSQGLDGKIVGNQLLMKEMNKEMISGQVMSITVTLVLIILMLLISLRSIKLTLLALVPILLTSVFLYGFLGMSGISLNLMTSTIFSITLGIGIDYAIHFVSVYKYYKHEEDALNIAFKYTSRPIIANAFGLAIGMSALMVSPLLIHLHISFLMWVSMISSVLLTLIIIPIILNSKFIKG